MIIKSDMIVSLIEESKGENFTDDPLVITPLYNIDKIKTSGSASIDLRLGTWFVSPIRSSLTHLDLIKQDTQASLMSTSYTPFGKDYYLHPGCFVLAITLEWIRIPKKYAAYVIGKSSWGRRGLIIATAAGVHPGFTGCLTLELSNVGEVPIAIRPGLSICQLFLHSVDDAGTKNIDKSEFSWHRKPTLGHIQIDDFAKKLSQSS